MIEGANNGIIYPSVSRYGASVMEVSPPIVAVLVDDPEKADRYVAKLAVAFPAAGVISRGFVGVGRVVCLRFRCRAT